MNKACRHCAVGGFAAAASALGLTLNLGGTRPGLRPKKQLQTIGPRIGLNNNISTKMNIEKKKNKDFEFKTWAVEGASDMKIGLRPKIPFEKIQKISYYHAAKTDETIMQRLQNKLATLIKCDEGIARALIFGVLHTGGTASKASPSHSFSFEIQQKTYFLDLKTLRVLCDKVARETSLKFTLRQLARTHEREILDFATKLEIRGNLQKKMTQLNPQIDPRFLIFAADYVDPLNPLLPEDIKVLLIEHKNQTLS